MATIVNTGTTTIEQFRTEIGEMSDQQLMAQELVQQGALHVIAALLRVGCTQTTATNMLASLKQNANWLREEVYRRDQTPLFAQDQTGAPSADPQLAVPEPPPPADAGSPLL